MHYEELGLNQVKISGKYLPGKYFAVAGSKPTVQALLATGATPEHLYAGTNHGLYRSSDAGKSWVSLKQGLFNQDIRALAGVAGESGLLYAGTAGGIFKSEDNGDHWPDWYDASSGLENGEVNDLVIHPQNPEKIFAATQGGLFYSGDAGESWERLFGGETPERAIAVTLVRLSSVRAKTIYIATEKGVYRSRNMGRDWQRVWANQITEVLSMVSLKTEPEFFYIGTPSGLFKSFNQGRSWIRDDNNDIKRASSILVNPRDTANLFIAAGDRTLVSQDGGDSWKEIGFHAGIRSGTFFSRNAPEITRILRAGYSSPVFLAGTTDGLFVSPDNGKTWTEAGLGLAENRLSPEEKKMDLVKLITEIHTGRFFGSYFFLLVDLATLGLVLLVFSGALITAYRKQIRKSRKGSQDEEQETDMLITIQETADDLSSESMEIHDMIEHISNHLEKCKTIYLTREKKEIEEIDRHITTLDKKMHTLMQRIGEFEKYTQN